MGEPVELELPIELAKQGSQRPALNPKFGRPGGMRKALARQIIEALRGRLSRPHQVAEPTVIALHLTLYGFLGEIFTLHLTLKLVRQLTKKLQISTRKIEQCCMCEI
jgi:hypothetical protein